MTLILIAGLILLAVAVTLIVGGAVQDDSSEAIQQIGAYGFRGQHVDTESEGRSARRALDGFANSIGGFASRKLGAPREEQRRKRLVGAGMYTTTPRKLVGYQLLFAISFPFLWFWIGSLLGGDRIVLVVGTIILP